MKTHIAFRCLTLIALALLSEAAMAQHDYSGLGRLFFTPERRAALERQRQLNIQEVRTIEGATLRLDGIVKRSGGKSTVWINGNPQSENEIQRSGVNVQLLPSKPGSALIAPGDEPATRLKVGEIVNRATGERDTRLGSGTVVTPNR